MGVSALRSGLLGLLGVLSVSTAAVSNDARLNGTADYALINGKVYTMDKAQPWAEAVTIEGKKITYVGDAAGLKKHIGISTEVIDLDGKMLMPGFVDGHIHAAAGGMILKGVDLQTDDRSEIFKRLNAYIADNPDLDVIVGWGVRFNPWTGGYPTAAMLDEVEAEKPVYLWTIDGHTAWVNSKALEIAGIDKDTPETVPGFSYFERDPQGNPTGWVVEIPAQLQVLSALVDINLDYVAEGVSEWLPKMSAAGITALADYGIQGISMEEGFQMLKDLEAGGKLPMRVLGVYYWNDPEIDPIPHVLKNIKEVDTELVKASRLKINFDGGDDKWNALYVDPYSDKRDIKPKPIIPYEVVDDVVKRADALGIDVVCHCFGDLAVRKLLDAVEAAAAVNPDRKRRNVISHGTLVHPDDYKRFKELDVTYDTTGAWMSYDPLIRDISVKRLGQDRVDLMFPMKAIADAGGNVSFGSDWPVSGYISNIRPLLSIQTAVTRQLQDDPGQPPLGGEAAQVPLDLALHAHTLGAAYGMAMDDQIGSIEVGKFADLVVLERNLFDVEPTEISDVKVIYTIMNGKLVFEAVR